MPGIRLSSSGTGCPLARLSRAWSSKGQSSRAAISYEFGVVGLLGQEVKKAMTKARTCKQERRNISIARR